MSYFKNQLVNKSRIDKNALFIFYTLFGLLVVSFVLFEICGKVWITEFFNNHTGGYIGEMIQYDNRTISSFSPLVHDIIYRAFALLALALGGFIVISIKSDNLWSEFFFAPTYAHTLALFRIILLTYVCIELPSLKELLHYTEYDSALRISPPLMSWWVDALPITTQLTQWGYLIFIFTTINGILGFKTRFNLVVASVLGLYIFGIPQFYGKINHYNHVIWFMSILAFSPCADVWSIDKWLQKDQAVPPPHQRYRLPIALISLLLGIIYFFPGFWKYVIHGPEWFTSDQLKYKLYQTWYMKDFIPIFRVDHYPLLYKLGGFLTITFELVFIFLILKPKWVKWAIFSGLLFHLSVLFLMNILFTSLPICYFIFLPLVYRKQSTSVHAIKHFSTKPLTLIGSFWIIGNILFGLFFVSSWPLSVYPTFATLAKPTLSSIALSIEGKDGQKRIISCITHPAFLMRDNGSKVRTSILFKKIIANQDKTEQQKQLLGISSQIEEYENKRILKNKTIRFYKVEIPLSPEANKEDFTSKTLLFEVKS